MTPCGAPVILIYYQVGITTVDRKLNRGLPHSPCSESCISNGICDVKSLSLCLLIDVLTIEQYKYSFVLIPALKKAVITPDPACVLFIPRLIYTLPYDINSVDLRTRSARNTGPQNKTKKGGVKESS